MAIAFRSSATSLSATLAPTPAGLAATDLWVVCILSQFPAAFTSTPAGWTQNGTTQVDTLGNVGVSIWWAPGNVAAATWGGGGTSLDLVSLAYTGAVTDGTAADGEAGAQVSGAGANPASPSISPAGATDLAIYAAQSGGTPTYSALAGGTVRQGNTTNGGGVAEIILAASGATGTKAWTVSTTVDNFALVSAAFLASGAAVPYVIPPDPYYVAKRA